MREPGRPQILDETKQWEVCVLISAGCSAEHAAQYVGCSARTIRRHAERDEVFRARLRRAEAGLRLSALETIRKASVTHWRAAAWLLDRTGAWRASPANSSANSRTQIDDMLDELTENPLLPPVRQEALCPVVSAEDGHNSNGFARGK